MRRLKNSNIVIDATSLLEAEGRRADIITQFIF